MSTNVSLRSGYWPGLLASVLLLAASAAWAEQVTPNDRVTSRLRVRSEAKSDGGLVGYLKPGETAELVKTMGGWREIKFAGSTGYVASTYTTVVPDGSSVSPAAAVSLPMPAGANLVGKQNVLLGIPLDANPSDDYLIDRDFWVASYNPERLEPNWVAWRLVAEDLGNVDRRNTFRADDTLPADFKKVGKNDYRRSGYDRGHVCPSADRTTTIEANDSTFLMSNMHPQLPPLNEVRWKQLEGKERDLAAGGKQLQIVAGGIFSATPKTIGPGVAVPNASFKIIVVLNASQTAADVTGLTTVCSFIMPNNTEVTNKKWYQYLVSVDEIEKQTGYDFLRDVPDTVEKVIEAKVPTSQECGAP